MKKELKDINAEYLAAINSSEYKLGKYMNLLKSGIKNRKFISNVKHIVMLKKLKKTKGKSKRFIEVDSDSNAESKRVAVYTVLFGKYDKIRNIYVKPKNCDFFIITDQTLSKESSWIKVPLSENEENIIKDMNVIEKNRYFKMLGSDYFKDYDYTIYIDANLEVYGDLSENLKYINETTGIAMFNHSSRGCIYKEAEACKIQKKGNWNAMYKQTMDYKSEGMPINFGMCECCVIVRDIKNNNSLKIMSSWWEEFIKRESYRDQIAWPYILWKNSYEINDIGCLGENIAVDGNYRRYEHGA